MPFLKPALFSLCAAIALSAQAPVDLNSLAAASAAFAAHGVKAGRHPAILDLRIMRGDNGGDPATLMARAGDVLRWTMFYDASYQLPVTEDVVLPRSASLKCTRGVFGDFFMSPGPVPDCKTLEATWMAVTLDGAIAQLNANGYLRGFSQVEAVRPDKAGCPDELVYLFTCPWERTRVAISATTGALSWYQQY